MKDEYYDYSILLAESICDAKNKYYPQTFLEKFVKERNNLIMSLMILF